MSFKRRLSFPKPVPMMMPTRGGGFLLASRPEWLFRYPTASVSCFCGDFDAMPSKNKGEYKAFGYVSLKEFADTEKIYCNTKTLAGQAIVMLFILIFA